MKDTGEFEEYSQERQYSFLEVVHVLREKTWLIAVCVIAALFAGFGYSARQSKIFRSKAVIEVTADEVSPLKFDETRPQEYKNQDALQTIVANFRSRTFLKKVVEKHGFATDPVFTKGARDLTSDDLIDRLLRVTQVGIRKDTRLIDITGESGDPQTAQKLAQSLADEFLSTLMEQRASTSRVAVKFLMDEAENLKARLQHSEEALQAYKESHGSVSLEEKQDTVVSKLKDQNTKLTDTKAARLRLEADYRKTTECAGSVEQLLTITSVSEAPAVVECRQQLATAETKLSTLLPQYTEKHPKMIQARAQLQDARAALKSAVLKMPGVIRASYEAAVVTERNFEMALKDQEKAALSLNRQAIPYNVLFRDVETDRALYEAILKRLKEADIAKGVELTNVRIFEPAQLPAGPASPNRLKVTLLSILGGLALGVALSFGLHLLDHSLKTVDQAERVTGLSVIGAIPHGEKGIKSKNDIILINDPKSVMAEAFRSFRVSLQMVAKRKDGGVFLFTSAMSAEGKTFSAIHMAVALAQQGLNTLIIDVDLRAPKIADIFGCDPHSPGVTDTLMSGKFDELHYQKTGIEHLSLMPAGTRIINPAELLSGSAFGKLVNSAAARFPAIIIDSAPIHAVSDTLLLVEHVDWVCLVARAGSTSANAVQRARAQLELAGAKIAGLALNQLPKDGGVGYYYYYSPGHYGTEGYGASEAESHKY